MTEQRTSRLIRWVVPVVSAVNIAMGGVWLIAWFTGQVADWSGAGAVTVKANTALCMLLSGLGLWLLAPPGVATARKGVGLLAASLVLLLGGLTLSEHVLSYDLGIDQLLAREAGPGVGAASRHRMGPPASLSFLFIGLGMLALGSKRIRSWAPYLGLVTCVIILIPAVGYLYGIGPLYRRAQLTGIAWPAVVMLLLLGLGLISAHRGSGPMALLARGDAGATLLRRLLPWAVLVPLSLGFLMLEGERAGLFDMTMGTGMLVIALVLVLSLLVWVGAKQLSRAASLQKQLEQGLAYEASFPQLNPNPIIEADVEGNVRYANPAAFRLFPEMRTLGPAHPFLRHWQPTVQTLWEKKTDVASRTVKVSGRSYHQTLVRAFEPGVIRAYGADITERIRAESALRDSEEQLRSLYEQNPAMVLLTKLDDGRIVQVNEALTDMLGFAKEEAIGRTTAELGILSLEEQRRFVEQAGELGQARNIEVGLRSKSGASVTGLLSSAVVQVDGGQYLLTVVADITDRKRIEQAIRAANEQLHEAARRRSEFLAVLSHELRNPLVPIKNSLYVLEKAAPGSDVARRATAVLGRQTELLAKLVDDLLDVTRIAQNWVRLQRQQLDLSELVRRTVDDYRSEFDKAEVALELETAAGPIWVNGDQGRLAQVVGNLLQNAAKYTPAGGRVQVSVSADPALEDAVVQVKDTGVGLAPEVAARLFEPFVQGELALDRDKGGLGLGLALVKGLVELHGGEVSAHSPGPGRGSEFTFRVPMLRPSAAVAATAAPRGDKTHRRVLVIEDNVDAAESLRAVLELEGHQVAVAHSGPSGIACARQFHPEVVLCDIGLPGMDGYQVARTFRGDQELQGTRLVALTGYALPEDMDRAAEAGFEQHVAKPPSIERLEQVVSGA